MLKKYSSIAVDFRPYEFNTSTQNLYTIQYTKLCKMPASKYDTRDIAYGSYGT